MLRQLYITILLIAPSLLAHAQFSYFSQISGTTDDQHAEIMGNVEVIGDHWYTFGLNSEPGDIVWELRKYNFEGDLVDLETYSFNYPNEYLYMGLTTSFFKLQDDSGFLLTKSKLEWGQGRGYVMRFDLNLDTLWTKKYDFHDYSGFDSFVEVDDGYVIVGYFQDDFSDFGGGSFIQKIDLSGDSIWAKILRPHESESYSFRNKSIVEKNDKFILGGNKDSSFGSNLIIEGVITIADNDGNLLAEIVSDDNGLNSSRYFVLKLSNGEILCSHIVAHSESVGGLYYWKTKVYKLDVDSQTFYWEHEYLQDQNLMGSAPAIPKETPDGGLIFKGGGYGDNYEYYTSLLKVDGSGNQEWYKEYVFEDCDYCRNLTWDYEIAPDGGYILVGEFTDYSQSLSGPSWMLKVDACGDVEFDGCEYVGIEENYHANNLMVYPNPTRSTVNFKLQGDQEITSVKMFDLLGNHVLSEESFGINSLDISQLVSGTYIMNLYLSSGINIIRKVQVLD
jgi:hypothetical protein